MVVNSVGKVIGGNTVALQQHMVNGIFGNLNIALNKVGKFNLILNITLASETNNIGQSLCQLFFNGFNIGVSVNSPLAVVAGVGIYCLLLTSDFLKLLFGAEAGIGLAFRNEINYLLSLRKPLVCVKLGEFRLGYGLDMQLANIRLLPYTTPEETAQALIDTGILTQDMMGEGMEKRNFNRKHTYIILGMVAAAVLIFALSLSAVIRERSTAAFVLQDVDGSAYVNISEYGDEGLAAMAGKSVEELDLSGGTFSSLRAIKDISAATVNVSGLPADVALWPVSQVQGIKTVKLSQEQLIYARELCNAGITVVVTH